MGLRENTQLALNLASSEHVLNEETRNELVQALAELLLTVALATCRPAAREEDADELEANI
jgi:hypothetical protein